MKGEARNPGPLQYQPPVLADWTVRERLALATAVVNCPDKNWATISRTVKRFASEHRDEDYFAPRHCARQYSDLMEKMDQPKRRGETAQYDCSPEELVVKMLTLDRIEELQAEVKITQELYKKTKSELADIESGRMDKRQVARLYAEMKAKEKEAPEEELIPVSEKDLARLQEPDSSVSDRPKDPVLQNEVIHSADLGVPKDDDYDEETRRLEEARETVVRCLTAPEVKKEADEVEEDDVATEEAVEEEARVEVKQEVEEEEKAISEEQTIAQEDRPFASPVSSSAASSPHRVPPNRPSSDAEDDDDDATEGDEEEGGGRSSRRSKAYRTWKKSIHMIIRAAQSHKHASVFLSPVTDDIANGYSQVVFRPMDLSTIKRRVDSGELRRTAEFQRDVMLMFTNAVMYNNAEHDVHKMALQMYEDVMSHIEQYLSTQVMSPSVESKVLRRRQSDHEDESPVGRRRRGSTDSKDDPPKKSRKCP